MLGTIVVVFVNHFSGFPSNCLHYGPLSLVGSCEEFDGINPRVHRYLSGSPDLVVPYASPMNMSWSTFLDVLPIHRLSRTLC